MVPEDEGHLQRLLGTERIPAEVLAEYELRVRMYHRAGASGPLGLLGMIDLIRFCGIAPVQPAAPPPQIEWRNVRVNTAVEARFYGTWMQGVFLGIVENGLLAIRLADDELVRECRRDMVRFPEPQSDTVSPTAVEPPAEPPPAPEPPAPPLASVPQDLDADPEIDWKQVPIGTSVWAMVGDDAKEGRYVGPAEGDLLSIEVDGETVQVPKALCYAA